MRQAEYARERAAPRTGLGALSMKSDEAEAAMNMAAGTVSLFMVRLLPGCVAVDSGLNAAHSPGF
jgi:hypothetical protein